MLVGHRGRRRGEIREGRAVVGEVLGTPVQWGRKIAREAVAEANAIGSRFQEFQSETNLAYGGQCTVKTLDLASVVSCPR